MTEDLFNPEDMKQMETHGLNPEEVWAQIQRFKKPPRYLNLIRPCTLGEGITAIPSEKLKAYQAACEKEVRKGRCLKFVPASGAASRMFRTLHLFLEKGDGITREKVAARADAGEKDAQELLKFMDGIRRFAFFNDLESVMSEKGLRMEALLKQGSFGEIIRLLLSDDGLNYSQLPKGLLKFHAYEDGNRTAFEEHLVEAALYAADRNRNCRLHFTVSPEHLERFGTLLENVRSSFEYKYDALFRVHFSVQKNSTDTIAVGFDNAPFREEDGRILFRPGGHGALIENLNDLQGDLIFIKNIDNVAPDRLKVVTLEWKKILCGYLVTLQDRLFSYLKRLFSGETNEPFLREVSDFVKNALDLRLPSPVDSAPPEKRRRYLFEQLNRPLRVCGMVKNEGEPGGGPFWVEEGDGQVSRQIVESIQVDPESKTQQNILASATHFNPVDLVCGVRDWQGRPFDLREFVDPDAVSISRKSKNGRGLKALELPGLWNGAMARWITLFVEVPPGTFSPVKTVNDLLRREHQPL